MIHSIVYLSLPYVAYLLIVNIWVWTLLPIVNAAAVNMGVQLPESLFEFFGDIYPDVEVLL